MQSGYIIDEVKYIEVIAQQNLVFRFWLQFLLNRRELLSKTFWMNDYLLTEKTVCEEYGLRKILTAWLSQ